ncbi:hypothetical protein H6P81_012179 [Aristolochia fimbriata]|uniref:MCM OB domain-containing protein n=1 Tax=Aristolochia fimbriata TaxID=158543 RepID=A0AAV7EDV7_ARIFI|nr:hypothetical protein H6P81_012179 [Aristolochia fimbriata]
MKEVKIQVSKELVAAQQAVCRRNIPCKVVSMAISTSKKVLKVVSGFVQVKIQELAEHAPKGHIPQTMTIHFRGELTRKVEP